jgi:phosphoglycerate dehydrogenase-like enzyme
VLATRRDPSRGGDGVDEVHPQEALSDLLPRADVVVLTCPLTPETENLIGSAALARMKPSAYLVNVARGRVVDEPALIEALAARQIAGAALDVTVTEPLPADSPLWAMPHVLLTPHTGGETRAYEEDLIDILLENLGRLQSGETVLRNGVV